MSAALLSLALAVASVILAGVVVRAAAGRRRAPGTGDGSLAVLVPLVAGGGAGRSLARCLVAAAHEGPRALRPVSLAGDDLARRWAEEVRRADAGADVEALGVEASPRHVLPAWLAASALEAAPGDRVLLADPRACPAAREAARLCAWAGAGRGWAAALPVAAPGAGAASRVAGGALEDLAPLLASACGAAALPPLLAAGPRDVVEAAAADARALHRPSLADGAARAAGAAAVLAPVAVALEAGREGEWASQWLRPLWRARPAGSAWTAVALLALPASLAAAVLGAGPSRAVALAAVLLACGARAATAAAFAWPARGGATAARAVLLAPLRDLAAASVLVSQAFRRRLRVAGADWQVRPDGVLAPGPRSS